MPGPPPKDASVRARRNRTAGGRVLGAGARRRRAPALPALPGREWQPQTTAWWSSVWASPMAVEFAAVDEHALAMIAVLVDDFWTEPNRQLAGELRLQLARFGLTPLDRRRLEWTIEQAEDAQEQGRRRRAGGIKQSTKRDDPRRALFAVAKDSESAG